MTNGDSEHPTGIDTAHLCRLSQLALSAEARQALDADLHNIIAMIDAMQAVDTTGVEPLTHPIQMSQRLRADVVSEQIDREALQASAPTDGNGQVQTRDGLYLVPRVVG